MSVTPATAAPAAIDRDSVDRAITGRRSIRRFLPTLVPESVVREIIDAARWAPSGTNMQPWEVIVLAGKRRQAVSDAILASGLGYDQTSEEKPYYPVPCPEPYISRRRKVGWALYGALGIVKGDTERMKAQSQRNYLFFDAPVGMIMTIDRVLEIGSWLDYGMFLQNIALAARARGLDTCMQAAFTKMHPILRRELGIPDSRIVVCGMALGHADLQAPENVFPVERVPVDGMARFEGF